MNDPIGNAANALATMIRSLRPQYVRGERNDDLLAVARSTLERLELAGEFSIDTTPMVADVIQTMENLKIDRDAAITILGAHIQRI